MRMNKEEASSQLFQVMKKVLQISARQVELAREAQSKSTLDDEFYVLVNEREALHHIIEQLQQQTFPSISISEVFDEKDILPLRELVTGIEANDRETRSIIGGMLKDLKNKIQSTRSNQKAIQAYSPPSLDNPWFFDKKK
jgi:hypothetical protein